MDYISYVKLWEIELDNIVSQTDKLQDLNFNQLKLEVHDTYQTNGKITTDFEPTDDSEVINKSYLEEKSKTKEGNNSEIEKDCNEFNLQYNKQSVEDISIQRAVKTTIPILNDKGLFDNLQKDYKFLEDFLFITRRKPYL